MILLSILVSKLLGTFSRPLLCKTIGTSEIGCGLPGVSIGLKSLSIRTVACNKHLKLPKGPFGLPDKTEQRGYVGGCVRGMAKTLLSSTATISQTVNREVYTSNPQSSSGQNTQKHCIEDGQKPKRVFSVS